MSADRLTDESAAVDDPASFVEMLQREADHLGRLQIGTLRIYRNVVKVHVCDEYGEVVADLDIPTASLDSDLMRRIWALQVDLAPLVADRLRQHAADAFQVLIDVAPVTDRSDSDASR